MKKFKLDSSTRRMRVSMYLKTYHSYSSRSMRTLQIFLDGKKVKASKKLPSTGILKVYEKEKETNIKPIKKELDIVFEDEDILVINKPYNLVTHPTLKKVDFTLANFVVAHINTVPRFYNRLDMDTTGLIVVAKNAFSQSYLQKFGDLKKKYMAIVEGKLEKKEYIVDAPIYKDNDNLRRIIDKRGQEAKTIIKRLAYNKENDISLIECTLLTGRTHQIRVHTSYIGHAILGDKLYNDNNKYKGRQLLHAYYLKFKHPRKEEVIELKIPLYKDMQEWSWEYE
ncbi:RluA family pseudouridine synthase [Oceanivirga miroungae]|uniref:Pseudouridine synthase n=1 Tax=Oceanivirga miroungae TaxID=1130046 RepID=A0A6I8MEH4_9FUSO|nr:RluA family pseudouridine synthase [Oceanivirga miroungae]VWL85618.1 pseudouridine synthase [Oceanivirga miroungae]